VLVTASIASDFGTAVGVLAGTIAVGGFLGHVRPALAEDPELEVRRAMAKGGLAGLAAAVVVVVLSAIQSKLGR
jgi:hypothetical protein